MTVIAFDVELVAAGIQRAQDASARPVCQDVQQTEPTVWEIPSMGAPQLSTQGLKSPQSMPGDSPDSPESRPNRETLSANHDLAQ